MDEMLVKVLFVLFGLYSGVMSWLFKMNWNDVQALKREVGALKSETLESIRNLIDERFDRFEERVDEKIEGGFTKLECAWMNDGRISPKKQKKEQG